MSNEMMMLQKLGITDRSKKSYLPRHGSKKYVVEIDVIDSFLHQVLLLLVIADVIADLTSKIQINSANFLDEEVGSDHAMQSICQFYEESHNLNPAQ